MVYGAPASAFTRPGELLRLALGEALATIRLTALSTKPAENALARTMSFPVVDELIGVASKVDREVHGRDAEPRRRSIVR
jgi:hypothetical protein